MFCFIKLQVAVEIDISSKPIIIEYAIEYMPNKSITVLMSFAGNNLNILNKCLWYVSAIIVTGAEFPWQKPWQP